MKAIIMAGGKGTRISSLNADIPKPMFPVLGKPILEYQIKSLVKSGIVDITLVVGHLKDVITEYFKDGSAFGAKIDYIEESQPLGTAGALYYQKNEIDDFILVFGDLMLDIDFVRFMNYHKNKNSAITLFCHPNSHPYDSDIIVSDSDGRVVQIIGKKEYRSFFYHNFVNAGVYCVNPRSLESIQKPEKIDLEKNIVMELIHKGEVYAYKSTEYVKDMGTPDRFESVSSDVEKGLVSSKNLSRRQKAIFLDRDGTINQYVGFLKAIDDFKLLPGVSTAISKINSSAFLVIVVTNQPVVARGEVTFSELDEIHKKMETELGESGAYLDDVFYSPHHPDRGFEGEVVYLKKNCECRKPKIGMLQKASDIYNIDLASSWFIGDATVDVQTGKNAGMKTILVKTGLAGKDGKYEVRPDYVADDLLSAISYILK